MVFNEELFEQIRQDIVDDAVRIYINSMVDLMHVENKTRKFSHPENVKARCLDQIFDVETFFLSGYGQKLTNLDGNIVMETLEKRARKQYEEIMEGKAKRMKKKTKEVA